MSSSRPRRPGLPAPRTRAGRPSRGHRPRESKSPPPLARATREPAGRAPIAEEWDRWAGSVERASRALGLGAPIGHLQRAAARRGSAEVLRWSAGVRPIDRVDGRSFCAWAAAAGSVEALAWLRGESPPFEWDARVCYEAARFGHVEVLQWARSQVPPCPWNGYAVTAAARGGHIAVLQWARSQDPPCPWGQWTWRAATEESEAESEDQKRAVIAWLREAGCPDAQVP